MTKGQDSAATGAGDVEKRVEYFADYGGQPPRELMREVLSSLAAARQENERLHAALEAAQKRFLEIATKRAFQPVLHAKAGANEITGVLARLSPAPKEPSHDDDNDEPNDETFTLAEHRHDD